MSARRLSLAFAVAGPLGPAVNESLDAYRALSRQHLEETVAFDRARARGAAERKPVEVDRVLPKILDQVPPKARLEYLVREPSRWREITLDDVARVGDVGFADEVLWAYVVGATEDFFRPRDTTWPLFRARVASAIAKTPALTGEKAPRRSWWAWFAGEEVEDPHADARLRALDRFLRLLASRDRDHQAEHLAEGRYALASHPQTRPLVEAFDREVARVFLSGLDRAGASTLMTSFDRVKSEPIYDGPKAAVLGLVARHCDARGWKDLGARALELANAVLEARDGADPQRALGLGDTYASIGRPDKAAFHYLRAIERGTRLEPWERVEARRGAARALLSIANESPSPVRERAREHAAEHLRIALNGGLATPYRDDLLESYGETLASLDQWKASFDVFEALFAGGARREARVKGLERALDSLIDGLNRNLSLKQKRIAYRRYLDLLVFYSRTAVERATLGKRLVPAREWATKLKLAGESTVSATLVEIEARARGEGEPR